MSQLSPLKIRVGIFDTDSDRMILFKKSAIQMVWLYD